MSSEAAEVKYQKNVLDSILSAPKKPRTRRRPTYGVATAEGRIDLPPIARATYSMAERARFESFGVPQSLSMPIDINLRNCITKFTYIGPNGPIEATESVMEITAKRLISPTQKNRNMFVVQSFGMVPEMLKIALYAVYQKKMSFQWIKVSEFGNAPSPTIYDATEAVIIHNLSDKDGYRKDERLRDILVQCQAKMVVILIDGRNGVSRFIEKFGYTINGGILNIENRPKATKI